jgi:hypothetical protein
MLKANVSLRARSTLSARKITAGQHLARQIHVAVGVELKI